MQLKNSPLNIKNHQQNFACPPHQCLSSPTYNATAECLWHGLQEQAHIIIQVKMYASFYKVIEIQ